MNWRGSTHTNSVQKGIGGSGADGRGQGIGWITAVTDVFNNLDRIRQGTEDNLHVAALCFVGATASAQPGSSQAVLAAGFQKTRGDPQSKGRWDPWQSSVTKSREQTPWPSPGVWRHCVHPGPLRGRHCTAPGFLPEFNINKPLFGTLQEKQFTNSRDSREMIINQTPVQSCIFLRTAEEKSGKLRMFVRRWDTSDTSVYVTVSLIIQASINLSCQLHSNVQQDSEMCHALYQAWRDGCK